MRRRLRDGLSRSSRPNVPNLLATGSERFNESDPGEDRRQPRIAEAGDALAHFLRGDFGHQAAPAQKSDAVVDAYESLNGGMQRVAAVDELTRVLKLFQNRSGTFLTGTRKELFGLLKSGDLDGRTALVRQHKGQIRIEPVFVQEPRAPLSWNGKCSPAACFALGE